MDPTHANLQGLQPDVLACAVYLVNAYRAAGYPAIITSGARSQSKNLAVGGAPGSRHLTGRAFDLGFLGYDPAPQNWLYPGGQLWKAMGGRWGGDFSMPDPIHFDGG